MLDDATIAAVADELVLADQNRQPVPLLTARYPKMEVEDSYKVQSLWRQRKEAAGGVVRGHKIGLTSKAMQDATGITEPDYGVIFEDMIFESGLSVPWERYTHPRIEVELAFVLKDELRGPGVNIFDVLRATEYVVPALEILDSRIEMKGRTIVDTISDNAAMGAMVIGGTPVAPDQIDLPRVGAALYVDNEVIETGLGAGVLGHPANGIHWLANRICQFGESLKPGEIVLAGSFTRPAWISKGQAVFADYGELGCVTCHFE